MARGRAATYAVQQDAILQHAARLFAERGFQGTSMLELAGAAGVSKALLYHYYEDKYQMLVAIAEGHIDRLAAVVHEVMATGHAPEARLQALVERFVAEYASAQAHHQVLVQDIKYLESEDQRRIRGKERAVVQAFAEAIAAAHPALGQQALGKPLAMLLFGMINWLFTWFREDGALDYARLSALVVALVGGGLASVAALQGKG